MADVTRFDESAQRLPEPFGRYRIVKRLGQGGMGSVYLAEDTQLGRRVALKVPEFGAGDGAEARQRFFREARTAATLDHPYLCAVYDVGEIAGHLYLAMAYIEGRSLAESIPGGGMPSRQVAELVGKLAVAMQEAHAKGVIHRDLKPANVMIKTTGEGREPVIVDFGLARHDRPERTRATRTGQVMGTLAYMAPEQVRGEAKELGPGCDIYALGVILYELLTGRLPFNGMGLAVVGQILTQEPLPPSVYRSDVDRRLEAICLKAMAKKVGDRYASMSELAAALTGWVRALAAGSPTASPGHSPTTMTQMSKPTGSEARVPQFSDRPAPQKIAPPPFALAPTPARFAEQPVEEEAVEALSMPLTAVPLAPARSEGIPALPVPPSVTTPSPAPKRPKLQPLAARIEPPRFQIPAWLTLIGVFAVVLFLGIGGIVALDGFRGGASGDHPTHEAAPASAKEEHSLLPAAAGEMHQAADLPPDSITTTVEKTPTVQITSGIEDPAGWSHKISNSSLGYDLQLLPALSDLGQIPTSGTNLLIVAAGAQGLHFREFDGTGKKVVDIDGRDLSEPTLSQVNLLKERLERLSSSNKLTESDAERIVHDVSLIVPELPITSKKSDLLLADEPPRPPPPLPTSKGGERPPAEPLKHAEYFDIRTNEPGEQIEGPAFKRPIKKMDLIGWEDKEIIDPADSLQLRSESDSKSLLVLIGSAYHEQHIAIFSNLNKYYAYNFQFKWERGLTEVSQASSLAGNRGEPAKVRDGAQIRRALGDCILKVETEDGEARYFLLRDPRDKRGEPAAETLFPYASGVDLYMYIPCRILEPKSSKSTKAYRTLVGSSRRIRLAGWSFRWNNPGRPSAQRSLVLRSANQNGEPLVAELTSGYTVTAVTDAQMPHFKLSIRSSIPRPVDSDAMIQEITNLVHTDIYVSIDINVDDQWYRLDDFKCPPIRVGKQR